MVPGEQAPTALAVLEEHNLPKSARPNTATMFQESGMIPTSEQERAKRVVGVEGDIVNSLRELPRVVSVEAAVSIPEVDPLRDVNEERPKPKASVIIVFRPDETKRPPITPEDVQKYVQAKLPELRMAGVSVLLIPLEMDVGGSDAPNGTVKSMIDPSRGCVEKENILDIDVCKGNKKKVIKIMLGALVVAGILATLVVIAVLRAMRYRKDLTRLTAQFQGLK